MHLDWDHQSQLINFVTFNKDLPIYIYTQQPTILCVNVFISPFKLFVNRILKYTKQTLNRKTEKISTTFNRIYSWILFIPYNLLTSVP